MEARDANDVGPCGRGVQIAVEQVLVHPLAENRDEQLSDFIEGEARKRVHDRPLAGLLPLHKAHVAGVRTERIEIVANDDRERHHGPLGGEGAATASHGLAKYLGKVVLHNRVVESALVAEVVIQHALIDVRAVRYLLHSGRAVTFRREQGLGRVEDTLAAPGGAPTLGARSLHGVRLRA